MTTSVRWALVLLAGSLLGAPAGAVDTGGVGVLGGVRREHTVQPGQTCRGLILVSNQGAEPAEVKVYQTDYTPLVGGCKYGEPGSSPRSNALWIALTPRQVVIPAGGQAEVNYTVSVPNDAGLRGSYWSLIMVEPMRPISVQQPAALEKEQVGATIQSLVRYAIGVLTHIGDTGARELRIVERQVQEAKGKRALQLRVENSGERVMRCKVWAELYNADGVSIGRYGQAGDNTFYPGCTTEAEIGLTGVPAGKHKALVIMDAGGEDVFGAQYDLDLTGVPCPND